ncbi:MAG TPA: NAD(P)/FAD-dependent oxidoreductase [Ktedonobacteraceae bacterium]|jgi:phytoene dehydrogenase-like protein|nr:NAD(P)/FAD-dependent oxidoreductase [Ktedonobacteraceae bacterium]
MIVIIGAGLAGLTCARQLVQASQQVLVLEATGRVGGRVRTEMNAEGYRLDQGFQVLFTAYPSAKRHLNYDELKQRKFEPGAILVKDGKRYEIADPLREPDRIVAGLLNPLISPADKLRVLRLRTHVMGLSTADIFAGKGQPDRGDESTEQYLRRLGFEEQGFIDHFARPFYGGIFLDRSLATSARMFQFTFKMLATGDTIIPAEGMQRIPEQLATTLPQGSVRYFAPVEELLVAEGKVRGVRLAGGEMIEADTVVVATDSPAAARLTGMALPARAVGSVCLYFAGDERLYAQRKILLNADPHAYVNNAVLITNIAPTYAPPRKHLLSVTVLDEPEGDDELIAHRCISEMAGWFPEHDLSGWKFLAAFRIPFSQFAQPPGIYDSLPGYRTSTEGLYLAGEYTKSSSIQGAMHSGEDAAQAIMRAREAAANAIPPEKFPPSGQLR